MDDGTPFNASTLTISSENAINSTLYDLSSTLGESVIQVIIRKHRNPYLEALPSFVYSMPAQLLILGITITLLGSLLIHLLFTIRYHWPLSKLNYVLQVSAVVLTLSNVSGNLAILISSLVERSQRSPYMFLYIEVPIPPKSWSKAELGAWLIYQGVVTLSVHTTHIQFLTLLFPSGLEVKIILALVAPLALASSFLSFVELSNIPAIVDLGEAIRDTCDSSLTLLYTLAIFLWSLTLNRERAWRSEGGTVAFGILALVLGSCGTALNFLEIKEERLKWLGGVVDCILLWQSWVSLWWWVSSGMYEGEAADVQGKRKKQADRIESKRLKKLRKLEALNNSNGVNANEGGSSGGSSGNSGLNLVRGIGQSVRRRIIGSNTNAIRSEPESIELQTISTSSPSSPPQTTTALPDSLPTIHTTSPSSATSSSDPIHSNPTFLSSLINPFLTRLRLAHDSSIAKKAAGAIPNAKHRNWGIRDLVNRGRREQGERRAEAGLERDGEGEEVGEGGGEVGREGRRAGFHLDGGVRLEGDDNEGDWEDENGRAAAEESGGSWSWSGWISKSRLKDVTPR